MRVASISTLRIGANFKSRGFLYNNTGPGAAARLYQSYSACFAKPNSEEVGGQIRSRKSLHSRVVAMAAIPSTQGAALLTSFDKDKIDDGFANIEYREGLEVPEAGEGEVLVRFTQRPVQTSDLSVARGLYGPKPFPSPLGQEGVGVVAKAAGGWKEGQRVVGTPWGVGTWQEYAAVKASNLMTVPDEMDDKTAAQSYANPLTAVGLVETANVPEGEFLLQSAAGSIVGRMVIQYAKHRGIKTINIVRRPGQVQELKDLGCEFFESCKILAAEVIDTSNEDVDKRVQEITGGEGAYAGIDSLGTEGTAQVLHNVRKGGTAYAFGALTGSSAHVQIMDLMAAKKLEGFMLTNWLAEGCDEKLKRTRQLLADKVITPLSGRSFPLKQVREAIAESNRPGRGAKVFLES